MKGLKKLVVFLLVLVLTLPGETAHAFTFVPKFIAHYKHHNKEHHPVGLIQFIAEHFTGEKAHDKHEHHRDEQENCPFSNNHTPVQFVYIFRKEPNLVLVNASLIPDQEKSELPHYRFTFSEYNGSIWQPPKIA